MVSTQLEIDPASLPTAQEVLVAPTEQRDVVVTPEIPRPIEAALELLRRYRHEQQEDAAVCEPAWPTTHYLLRDEHGEHQLYDASLTDESQVDGLDALAQTEDSDLRKQLQEALGLTLAQVGSSEYAASLHEHGYALEQRAQHEAALTILVLQSNGVGVARVELPHITLPDDDELALPITQAEELRQSPSDAKEPLEPADSVEDASETVDKVYRYSLQLVLTEHGPEFWMGGKPHAGIDQADPRIQQAIEQLLATGEACIVDEEHGFRTTVQYRCVGDIDSLETGQTLDIEVLSESVRIEEKEQLMDALDDDADDSDAILMEPVAAIPSAIVAKEGVTTPHQLEDWLLAENWSINEQAGMIADVFLYPPATFHNVEHNLDTYIQREATATKTRVYERAMDQAEAWVDAVALPDVPTQRIDVIPQHAALPAYDVMREEPVVAFARPDNQPGQPMLHDTTSGTEAIPDVNIQPEPRPASPNPPHTMHQLRQTNDHQPLAPKGETPPPTTASEATMPAIQTVSSEHVRRPRTPPTTPTPPPLATPVPREVVATNVTVQGEQHTKRHTAARAAKTSTRSEQHVPSVSRQAVRRMIQRSAATKQTYKSAGRDSTTTANEIQQRQGQVSAKKQPTQHKHTRQQSQPSAARPTATTSTAAIQRRSRLTNSTARKHQALAAPSHSHDTARTVLAAAIEHLEAGTITLRSGDSPIHPSSIRPLSIACEDIARAAYRFPSISVVVNIEPGIVRFDPMSTEPVERAAFLTTIAAHPLRFTIDASNSLVYQLTT